MRAETEEPGEVASAESGAIPPFEEIVRFYHKDVRGYVARFLGNDAAADDVAQEVFVQVYRSLESFAGRSSLKSWILGIARNRVGTWFRQQRRQIRFRTLDVESDLVQYRMLEWQNETSSSSESDRGNPDGAGSELSLLRSCLEKLKGPQRTLVQRFYFEGVTAETLGREQGRNAGTIRMALLRIREALAKCIRKQAARISNNE